MRQRETCLMLAVLGAAVVSIAPAKAQMGPPATDLGQPYYPYDYSYSNNYPYDYSQGYGYGQGYPYDYAYGSGHGGSGYGHPYTYANPSVLGREVTEPLGTGQGR